MFKFIKKGFNITQSRQHITGLQGSLRSRLEGFRQDRSAHAQDALSQDFSAVLEAWGIANKAHIPTAITALRLRYVVFALPMLCTLVAAFILQNIIAYLSLVCVLLPCFLGIITTMWRISVLKHRQFIPFLTWAILGRKLYTRFKLP